MSARIVFSCLLVLLAGTAGVRAQERDRAASEPPSPDSLPRLSQNDSTGDRQARLDRLFERLAGATTADDARRYEAGIESLWRQSGSDTADLLISRALELVNAEDQAGALKMLGAALEVKPDNAEGWNKRATLFFLRGDFSHAMRDIRETLRYEPRHYGAWAGLGRILEQTGDDARALDAYRRALAINPQIDGLREQVRTLATKVRGEEL
jgi:Tfp pilus assembly protein PilF